MKVDGSTGLVTQKGTLLVNPGDAICQHGDEVEEGETDGGVAAEDNGGRGKAE